jgi:hypothetical protein
MPGDLIRYSKRTAWQLNVPKVENIATISAPTGGFKKVTMTCAGVKFFSKAGIA